jgi:hypothetical protein
MTYPRVINFSDNSTKNDEQEQICNLCPNQGEIRKTPRGKVLPKTLHFSMNAAAFSPVPLYPTPQRRCLVLRFARKTKMDWAGKDSTGRVFDRASEMWQEEIGGGVEAGSDQTKLRDWYSKGISYWQVIVSV